MGWFKKLIHHDHESESDAHNADNAPPPEWAPAPEQSHAEGRFEDASTDSFKAGGAFCQRYPVERPRLLPSDVVDRIAQQGCAAWGLSQPITSNFHGRMGPSPGDSKGGNGLISVETDDKCDDTCLMSNFPIAAGMYASGRKEGVYFEITVRDTSGTIAIGTTCRPYPEFRLPGWNRLSMGLHLDDLRKFCEDPDGGQDYAFSSIQPGDVIGCGLSFTNSQLFFTHNGQRMNNAFSGLYMPREEYDVYAAIGVCGRNALDVNFGAALFRWKEGNEWAWRVEGHVGRLEGPAIDEDLPSYNAASSSAGY